ncbi:MAG: guanosine monophosphate reductase [Candidatus Shapirobacteria bacterium]
MTDFPLALTFSDVLLEPQRSRVSSRSQISLKTHLTPKIAIDFPLIAENMDCVTGVNLAVSMAKYGGTSFYPRFAPPPIQAAEIKQILDAGFLTIPAVGIKPLEHARVDLLYSLGIRAITIDIAHGHQESCLTFLQDVKKRYPDLEIIAGVVGTYNGAYDLYDAGADAVRVGVGPGSICTTRMTTGCGVPQITAILETAKAAREFNRPLIADGGTKNSGDIVKALAAGADAISTGFLLAGADESAGKPVEVNGQPYKTYNGSTSKTEKLSQLAQNPADKSAEYTSYVEGIEGLVPSTGPIADTLQKLEMGIRSGLSYCGAFNIPELHQKAKFLRVTPSITHENLNRGIFSP